MKRADFLLLERLVYLTLILGLQWNVFREGCRFAQHAQAVIAIPGLRHDGWLLGRNDLSDFQWRSFRDSAPRLAAAMAGFLIVSHLARLFRNRRQILMVAVSLLFLGVLHGFCALHVVALALGAFGVSRLLAGTPYGLPAIWTYACGTLLLARVTEGLPFASISPSLAPLDRHRGMLRWHIHYNLLILRIISFAADLHWARGARRSRSGRGSSDGGGGGSGGGGGGEVGGGGRGVESRDAQRSQAPGSAGDGRARSLEQELRVRVETALPLPYYGLGPFLEYVLYPPLYIAGPIITFNSFTSQRMGSRPRQLGPTQVLLYALRAALAWVCLEVVTHTLPYNAIAKHRVLDALAAASAAQASGGGGPGAAAAAAAVPAPRPLHYAITGYWVLVFMWLKFTVIWRFFRAAALADGIAPPENMTRCVCNNYDVEGFWRSWHASYNRWLVRYMYVPLGGSAWRAANVWPIFTFVALWHDLEWRLLGWAWLMAAAIAPEMAAKALARSAAARRWRGTALFRHVCALAAAVNILLLMTGNLVGFVVGLDGIGPLAKQVLGQPRFLAVVVVTLFAAAHLMFWKRELEARGPAAPDAAATNTAADGGGGKALLSSPTSPSVVTRDG